MRKLYLFSAVAIIALSIPAAVRCQIYQNWATSYPAPSAGNAHIATDGTGNSYIAANTTATSYTLIKYNAAGTQQWVTTSVTGITQPGSGVVGVRTDNAGNVYVVSNGSSGVFVTAYVPTGSQLWATAINTAGLSAMAYAMSVDGVGNVYIGGRVNIPITDVGQYMTVKVSKGIQKYLATFEGSGKQFSYVTGITNDAAGNAYVTGTSIGIHSFFRFIYPATRVVYYDTTFDMTTIKYDSSGNTLWTNIYHAGYGAADFGFSVAVDPSSGTVYALGQSERTAGVVSDLVAYSSSGAQQWVTQNSASANNQSMAIDPSGNIITGGTFYFNISKFSPSGSLTWSYNNAAVSLLPSAFDGYLAMVLDNTGNCYITAPLSNSTDYYTAEISPAGILSWSTTVSTGGSGGSSGIAIYAPVSRLGIVSYPQINVTGSSANHTNLTTIQYQYRLVTRLSNNAETQAGGPGNLPAVPAERLFNYPNPFKASTTIGYTLQNDSHVLLQLFDQSGKLVAGLYEGDQTAGTYTLPFNAGRLAAGIYHYRIVAVSAQGNFVQTKSLAVLP